MEKELFSYEADGTALIIHLPGEVDHHNCITLKYETDLLLEENYINRIVFDFTSTMEGSGGTVAVYGVGPRIGRILKIGGVNRLVQEYRSREEALGKP